MAQLAEQLICNQQVNGSSPLIGSLYGWLPEWPKGTDCKSAANCFGGSNPPPSITGEHLASLVLAKGFIPIIIRTRYGFHNDAGWSSLEARRAHNPKVIGSNPVPATTCLDSSVGRAED